MRTNQVMEIGNIVHTGNWSSPQRGRIYSTEGIAPCCYCYGGGNLETKILEIVYEQQETGDASPE